jgi:hypothetical protein
MIFLESPPWGNISSGPVPKTGFGREQPVGRIDAAGRSQTPCFGIGLKAANRTVLHTIKQKLRMFQ